MAAANGSFHSSSSSQRFQYPDLTASSFAPKIDLQGVRPFGSLKSTGMSSSAVGGDTNRTMSDMEISDEIFPSDADVEAELEDLQSSQILAEVASPNGSFRSPRGFYIPSERMQAALQADPGSEASHWHYTLYRGPEEASSEVKVHYCSTKDQMEKVLREHFMNETVLGLDLEWKYPSRGKMGIKQSVSLIQIANEERIGLFHLARFAGEKAADFVSPTLKAIVESPHVRKCGVAIKGDCTRLKNYLELECQGQFELTHLFKLVKYYRGETIDMNKRLRSLKDQVEEIFGLPLLKDEVRTSDWSTSKALSMEQCRYAASDAYACVQLFHQMDAARLRLDPVPPLPAHAELCLPLLAKPIRMVFVDDDGVDDLGSESSEGSFESVISLSSDTQSSREGQEEDDELDEVSQTFSKIGLEPEKTPDKTRLKNGQSRAQQSGSRKGSTSAVPPSTELNLASKWATDFVASNPNRKVAPPSALRAYHLWYYQNIDAYSIKSILRDPPLSAVTVSNYIFDAVYLSNLPAVPQRLVEMHDQGPKPRFPSHKRIMQKAFAVAKERQGSHEVFDDAANIGWWK